MFNNLEHWLFWGILVNFTTNLSFFIFHMFSLFVAGNDQIKNFNYNGLGFWTLIIQAKFCLFLHNFSKLQQNSTKICIRAIMKTSDIKVHEVRSQCYKRKFVFNFLYFFNREHSIFLLQNFLLHKIKVALKSLWSFCDLVETSNINNELKASALH